MARLKSAGAAGIFMVLLGTAVAHADVTAEQVWEAWQGQYTALGYEIATGASNRNGDTLALRDIVLTMTQEGSTMAMTIPELDFVDQGDGTVTVTFSDEITATSKTSMATMEGQPTLSMDMKIRKSDALALVSGTPEALSYKFTVPEMEVEMAQTASGGTPTAPVTMLFSLSGIAGVYDVNRANAAQNYVTSFTAAGMTLTASGTDPNSNGTFALEGHLADLSMTSEGAMPDGFTAQDLGAAIAKGMKATGSLRHGMAEYTMEATDGNGPTNVAGSTQSGTLDFAMAPEGLRYAATGQKSSLTVQAAQLPVPMRADFDDTSFEIAFPIAKSETPVPFAAKIGLLGLTVSEELWAMFDPQAKLPRDPANLVIDLTGTARPLLDFFSPEMAQSQTPPAELNSLDINKVQIAVAGADLSGTGALTFDNTMGMPMPLGAIDLSLSGANKLMDNLVAMGLMPEDQVMFGRMMLGLYAVPAGDDLMTSKIEFKEGGEILANGQRIQ